MSAPVTPSPWAALRARTPARIALGHSGVSLPTAPHLQFQLDHARARRAVHHPLPVADLCAELGGQSGLPVLALHSAAADRATYLQRPDLGRRLNAQSAATLAAQPAQAGFDFSIVIADGLSARAIEENARAFLQAYLPLATARGLSLAPLVLVEQGRVAIADEIAAGFGAAQCAILIGERPGLSSPDSMGVYFTHAPRPGLTDADRNCLSNIRPAGQSPGEAARKLAWLSVQARSLGLSGVALKDTSDTPQLG